MKIPLRSSSNRGKLTSSLKVSRSRAKVRYEEDTDEETLRVVKFQLKVELLEGVGKFLEEKLI